MDVEEQEVWPVPPDYLTYDQAVERTSQLHIMKRTKQCVTAIIDSRYAEAENFNELPW